MTSTPINPFTERNCITDPERFTGRWSELSLIFERLEAGRPMLVSGPAGIGKSSLLTHIVQSAAVNLELPDLHAYYLDMRNFASARELYSTIIQALKQRGDTLAALEIALIAADAPVLLALDNAQVVLAEDWGAQLLEALARVVRGGHLLLVVAMEGTPQQLSEPFAMLRLGALAQTEVRLLVETYLDASEITFTPAELRRIAELSGAHPAYVQRAAFYLFQSKIDPRIDWQAAYRVEVRSQPIPGAPLPPAVFEGASAGHGERSDYDTGEGEPMVAGPQLLPIPEVQPIWLLLGPLILALLAWLLLHNGVIAIVAALLGLAIGLAWPRLRRRL